MQVRLRTWIRNHAAKTENLASTMMQTLPLLVVICPAAKTVNVQNVRTAVKMANAPKGGIAASLW